MKILTLVLEIGDDDLRTVQPTLEQVIDDDSTLGLRLKDIDGMPENQLAPQVYARVLSMGSS
jgi:hypothetical protein